MFWSSSLDSGDISYVSLRWWCNTSSTSWVLSLSSVSVPTPVCRVFFLQPHKSHLIFQNLHFLPSFGTPFLCAAPVSESAQEVLSGRWGPQPRTAGTCLSADGEVPWRTLLCRSFSMRSKGDQNLTLTSAKERNAGHRGRNDETAAFPLR